MVDAADRKSGDEAAESAETAVKASGRAAAWRRFFSKNWIATIVVASVVVHGLGFTYYQLWGKTRQTPPAPEIALGVFQFAGPKGDAAPVTAAEFSLYVTLLEHADRSGRQQLGARRFRVQQDVEQLLRQAHNADFEEPNLAELKRQLQEQINQSLGLRVIGDVIITDLKLARGSKAALPVSDTAAATAGREKTAD